VGLEILLDHESLDSTFLPMLKDYSERVRNQGRPCRIHAPFRDLRPAGQDPAAVDLARERLQAALDWAPAFGARTLVVHTSWEARWDILEREEWLDRSLEFWTSFQKTLQEGELRFAFENVDDRSPDLLADLLSSLDPRTFGVNFDTGHWNVASEASLEDWFARLSGRLFSLHIHDNGGEMDEHLAVGQGTFPWDDFYSRVRALDCPLEWTVENRAASDILESARHVARFSGLEEFSSLASDLKSALEKAEGAS
jgi:sugar phosphate isomerase/epimerase